MTHESSNLWRAALSTLRLLLLAVAVGAALAVVTKVLFQFILWLVEMLWSRLPERIGATPGDLWYMIAVLGVGGLLVGLGNRFIGYHPRPLEEVTADMSEGKPIDHRTIPNSIANSVASLGFGGPLGPEALLVSVVGGLYFWVDGRMRGLATSIFSSLTGRDPSDAGKPWQYAPALITAISVVAVFTALPGGVDLSFVPRPTAPAALGSLALAAASGLVGGLVGMFTARLHTRIRAMGLFRRAPELVGIAGGLLVALLAAGTLDVLFSGAEEMSSLFDGSLSTGEITYAGVAKWVGLAVVLGAGWKGGPIFPLMFIAGALGVAAGDSLGLEEVILYAGAISGVVTGALGSMALGVLVALLVVPATLMVPLIMGGVMAGLMLRLEKRAESRADSSPVDEPSP